MQKTLTAILVSAIAALAQTAKFEVASIKPAAPSTGNRVMVRMGGDPGRVNYTNVALKDVLARAYNLKRYEISGPSWLDTERFDIQAKVPDGVGPDQVPAMLQDLLAERFKMIVHREKKEQSVYAMVVGKNGPKLKKSEDDGTGKPGPDGRTMTKGMFMISNGHVDFRKATMASFSDMLSNMLDKPVLDMTGLEGQYDIQLDVSPEDMAGMRKHGAMMMALGHAPGGPSAEAAGPAPEAAPSASIFTAIQQLGLKLESRKELVDYLVVDKAEKVPTEN